MKVINSFTVLFCFLLLIESIMLVSCEENKQTSLSKYAVGTVLRGDAVVYMDFPTQIISTQVVKILPRVTGYIREIYVQEGDNVRKGQPLVKIEDNDYQQNVNATKAAYHNAKLQVEQLKPLVEKGIISPYQLTAANSNLDAAKANYEYAKIMLGYTLIKSPVSGVVGRIVLRPGSLLSIGTTDPFTTVSANGDVWAYFAFDEKQVLMLDTLVGTLQQKVSYLPKVDLLLADGSRYPIKGKVVLGSSIVDAATGSLQLKAIFHNPKGIIHTGSFGTISLPTIYHHVLLIPQKATFTIQDQYLLYKVDSAGIVHATNVKVLNNSNANFIITSGVKEGDKILLEGITQVRDGDKIIPIDIKDSTTHKYISTQ